MMFSGLCSHSKAMTAAAGLGVSGLYGFPGEAIDGLPVNGGFGGVRPRRQGHANPRVGNASVEHVGIKPVDNRPCVTADRAKLLDLARTRPALADRQQLYKLVSGAGCDRADGTCADPGAFLGLKVCDEAHGPVIVGPRPGGHAKAVVLA